MEPSPKRTLAMLAVLAAFSAVTAWMMLPAWERDHMTAVARCRARSVIGWLARRSARTAMHEELRTGGPQAAAWRYQMTEHLSKLRDSLGGRP